MKMQKYRSKKTIFDGITFDSQKEFRRYKQLKEMQEHGEIRDLHLQVPFELIPAQREPDTIGKKGGIHKGKVIERSVNYIADFVYCQISTGETIVEDTKGMRTKDYIIKRKLMLYRYGIRIKEV